MVREMGIRALAAPLLIASLGMGCAAEAPHGSITEIDSAGIRVVTSEAPAAEWALEEAPELQLGPGTSGGPTEFYQVEAVRFLPGDGLAIANRGTEELRFFGADGGFLRTVGGDGRGPGEFEGLSWLAVRGDSLLSYDWGNDRVSVWHTGGAYSRTFRLEWVSGLITPSTLLRDGSLLSVTVRHMTELAGAGTLLELGLISRHDLSGVLLDSLGRFPVGERVVQRDGKMQTTVSLPMGPEAGFAAADDGFCYVFGPRYEVKCFKSDGRQASIARVDSVPRQVTPEDVEQAFEGALNDARAARNQPRVDALLRVRRSMVFPEFFPAFTALISDDWDRLWAKRFAQPGQATSEWWVFQDGRWGARLRVEGAFTLMDVSGDRAVGVWRDELGVEEIRVYRFAPS